MPEPVMLKNSPDVLEMIPYLVGFRPRESFVLVSLGATATAAQRVGMVARLDLDATAHPHVAAQLVTALRRDEATAVIVALYVEHLPDRQTWAHVTRLISALEHHAAPVVDCLLVTGDQWRSLLAPDGPGRGDEAGQLSGQSLVAAELVHAGLGVAQDRQDRLRLIAPEPGERRAPVESYVHGSVVRSTQQAVAAFEAWRILLGAAVRRVRGDAQDWPQDEGWYKAVGTVAAAVSGSLRFRDGLLTDSVVASDPVALWESAEASCESVLHSTVGPVGDRIRAAVEVWALLARMTTGRHRADALAALAWTCWYDGNLGFASDVAAAAQEDHPQPLAYMVQTMCATGLGPRWTTPQPTAPVP